MDIAAASADCEIVITRTIAAPRERVWDAWTTPEHLAHWWGPNGFTITTHEFAFTVGGVWRFMMHGPDGRDYPNHIVFTEIKKPERISNDHGADDGKVHFRATVTFEEEAGPPGQTGRTGQTKVTMRSVFPSREERDRVIEEHGAIEGGKQTLSRLDDYVAGIRS